MPFAFLKGNPSKPMAPPLNESKGPLEYHPGKQATHPQQEGTLGGSEVITASLDLRET